MKRTDSIIILTHEARWKGQGPTVRQAAEAVFLNRKIRKASVTIVLADDAEVKRLNKTYRGKNKPTNVLSFPDGTIVDGMHQLGDVILAYETVKAEAAAQGKLFKAHVSHLVIHGILHLLGYDHEIEEEADIMEAFEIQILKRMGVANPYEAV